MAGDQSLPPPFCFPERGWIKKVETGRIPYSYLASICSYHRAGKISRYDLNIRTV
jgi:hypothetical protein